MTLLFIYLILKNQHNNIDNGKIILSAATNEKKMFLFFRA